MNERSYNFIFMSLLSYRPSHRKTKNMEKKNIVIGALVLVVVLMLGVIVNLKRAHDLAVYAITNDCTWTATGTMYGDDRDYICK